MNGEEQWSMTASLLIDDMCYLLYSSASFSGLLSYMPLRNFNRSTFSRWGEYKAAKMIEERLCDTVLFNQMFMLKFNEISRFVSK
ncbi:hypothetical protein J2Y37_000682 [Prolinoborus sp. 3657]|nr:hypothetical protein [Prolinoborus sp. 3657]